MKTPSSQVRQKRNAKKSAPQAGNNHVVFSEIKIVRLNDHQAKNPIIDTPAAVESFWREHVVNSKAYDSERENLVVFTLNVRHAVTNFQIVGGGTLDTVLARAAEILRPAVIQNAAAIVLAHNHPSGDPSPSDADIKVTRDLIRACRVMKLELLDHVVIGADKITSLRSLGHFDEIPAPEDYSIPAVKTAGTPASDIQAEALAALDELEKCGAAAIALAMLNASRIKVCIHDNDGWQDFESIAFGIGNLELPRILDEEFKGGISAWRDEMTVVAQKSEAPNYFSRNNTENVVSAIKHLIDLQGFELSDRNHNCSFAASFIVMERLTRAFDKALKITVDLSKQFRAAA